MNLPDFSAISLDKIVCPEFLRKDAVLDVLRLDKIHPVISGNKWFKLKYHLENYRMGQYKGLLTFGGNWSNHIVATACACSYEKIPAVGIIRGEKPTSLSKSLQEAMQFKMQLEFIPRKLYQQKNKQSFLEKIKTAYPDFYIVPEGGAGSAGEKGAGEILNLVDKNFYTHIVCAVGTGTFLKGIRKAALPQQQVWGVVVLKGEDKTSVPNETRFFYDYHFGGFAKKNSTLIHFMNHYFKLTSIPTDFVYTGKLAYAVVDLLKKNIFPEGSKILMIHSGGLQGNRSLPEKTLLF